MRGLPPLQALVLLVALGVLGFAGHHFIDMGAPTSSPLPIPTEPSQNSTIDVEIELTFSSPPLSYTLSQASESGAENKVIQSSRAPAENPSYADVSLVAHRLTTYWLDVVWPDDAAQDAHHFVQINIAPSHGEGQQFSFFSNSKEMNETFDYNTGGSRHE